MPRPIEMNAHDPRRYLGDMLAWLHQALASERELLISLFGQDDPSHGGDHANGHFDVPSSSALLDRVVEGVCRPLRVGHFVIALRGVALRGNRPQSRGICTVQIVHEQMLTANVPLVF